MMSATTGLRSTRQVGMARGGVVALATAALFLVAGGSVFAANPFLGKWAIESFGQAEDLIFQFTSDTEMIMAVGADTTPVQGYTIDQAAGHLTLPLSDGNLIVLRYTWTSKDTFLLYMSDSLLEEMVGAFTASLPQGANALTNEVVEQLRAAVRDVFVKNPFMRGTRLD
jgi:hypothetical protein